MRKQFLVALCIVGLVLGSVTWASAGAFQWTILTHTSVKNKAPGANWLVETTDGAANCNFNTAVSCASNGTPTTGSFSYSYLDFQMVKSCATGTNRGASCNTNADCLNGGMCVPCGPDATSFFGKIPGVSIGTGTISVCQENGSTFNITAMGIGSTEALQGSGGGCLTLKAPAGDRGGQCGVGAKTSLIDIGLWVEELGVVCGIYAGDIPDVALDGRVYQKGSYPAAVNCGFTTVPTAYVSDLFSKAPTNATYMWVACEEQTLPGNLTTACLSGAPFKSLMITTTTANAATFDCTAACSSGGCMMGTAEETE